MDGGKGTLTLRTRVPYTAPRFCVCVVVAQLRPPAPTSHVLQILGFPSGTMVILRQMRDGKLLYKKEGTRFGAAA